MGPCFFGGIRMVQKTGKSDLFSESDALLFVLFCVASSDETYSHSP